jgi:hypothetical protein
MNRIVRRIAGAARRLAIAAVAAAAASAALLAHPQPLFAHRLAEGRLELWSDLPFSERAGRSLLSEVERRLKTSELDRPLERYCIFVVNSPWRRRLTFLWNPRAGGLSYYPLTTNVFIRASDIDRGVVFSPSGSPVPAPRTLAYYAAHEIGHNLTGASIGFEAYFKLPDWVREGVADYIGFGGDVDVPAMANALKAGEREFDPSLGFYARYRLEIAYLAQRKGWSIGKILNQPPDRAEVDAEIRALK